MKEIWKDIKGYKGLYQISNFGRVKSFIKWRGTDVRILSPFCITGNYQQVVLIKNKKKKYLSIHRLVAEAFIANKDKKNCINHKDCNKLNNHVDNLEWCTYSENIKHAYKNGLRKNTNYRKGNDNHNSKLTMDQVLSIRKEYGKENSSRKLGRKYNVSKTAILFIINKKNWKHLPEKN